MRYLPSLIVGVHHQVTLNPTMGSVFEDAQPPDWLWPRFDQPEDVQRRAAERVIREYVGKVPFVEPTLAERVRAVPWDRWVRPALGWGTLIAMLWGAVLFASLIVRRQWVENERLAFSLAGVYLSLIEPPQPGRMLNPTLRSRAFWLAAGAVFSVAAGGAAKASIVRLGGAPLLRSAKPVFLGLIIGEAGAAAMWLILSLLRSTAGYEYHAVRLLPG